jgi:hypothetical protein
MFDCLILIPSLNRPQRLELTAGYIHANTPQSHKILFCVSDLESKAILAEMGEAFIDDSDAPDQRYVTRMNRMVRHPLVAEAQTLFFGSDDVIHHPDWLGEAFKVMFDGPKVVVVNDLHNANGTQALMHVDYLPQAVFDSPGDAFHGGYHHNFADNEQHFTAWKRQTYGRALSSLVEHLHPLFRADNAIGWDPTYTDAMQGWAHDEQLFRERSALIEQALAY